MIELLHTFSRVVVAFLSGALLIVGTTFWADVLGGLGSGSAFDQVAGMLSNEFKNIFIVITALTAYVIGMINFAGSSVAFRHLANATESDLLLVSRIEFLQQPQLLKEVLDLLQLKHTLVAFTFPLFYFGVALACDFKEQSFPHTVRIAAGISLTILAGVAPFFAARMTRLLDTTAKKLFAETPKCASINNIYNSTLAGVG
jgi:NAD/NADP transhydrogenase beta subunit